MRLQFENNLNGGFTLPQQQLIQQSWSAIPGVLENCYNNLFPDVKDVARELYQEYFGDASGSGVKQVREVIIKMKQVLKELSFNTTAPNPPTMIFHHVPGALGAAYRPFNYGRWNQQKVLEIYVDRDQMNLGNLFQTLTHELSHLAAGTEDIQTNLPGHGVVDVYGRVLAQALAANNRQAARGNAENYCFFLDEARLRRLR